MPTYQYACTTCGHQLEAVQSFTDEALTDCPACDGQLRKLFSAVGIVFKGSGFYRTDSRSGNDSRSGSDSRTGSTANDSKSGSTTASGDAGSSDSSKPASTSTAAGESASGSGGSNGSSKPASGSTNKTAAPAKASSTTSG